MNPVDAVFGFVNNHAGPRNGASISWRTKEEIRISLISCEEGRCSDDWIQLEWKGAEAGPILACQWPRYRSLKLNLERVAKNNIILMMTKSSDE